MRDKDLIAMNGRELRRLKVIEEAIKKRITQRESASMVGLSERQVRRIVKRVRAEGEVGVTHRLRGKPSNRRIPRQVREKVIRLYRRDYVGFGPTLAKEKLLERDGIRISKETLRKWLIEEHLWQQRRKRRRHRRWRERKGCFGEMVQVDGSHHDWLEGRGPELVLMAYIDDATSAVFGRFYEYEGTFPAMDSFRAYIGCYGVPQSLYLDKHTTYKSTGKLTIEEELEGIGEPKSQFERALGELGVEVIHANSPQAKGRIERLFGTFQDRLIKEMRLRGIKSKEEANTFLEGYLPLYNRRFSVSPARGVDLHRRKPRSTELDRILSIRTKRALRRDFTIVHNRQLYQVENTPPHTRAKSVVVEERTDGRMYITYNGLKLKYRKIDTRPSKAKEQKLHKRRKTYIPPPDHPWRRSNSTIFRNRHHQAEEEPCLVSTK
jgi:hypothetical protein